MAVETGQTQEIGFRYETVEGGGADVGSSMVVTGGSGVGSGSCAGSSRMG